VLRLAGERAERRSAHWQAIAVAACEQSGRNRVPQVLPPQPLRDWLAGQPASLPVSLPPDGLRLVLSLADGTLPLRQRLAAHGGGPVSLLSGPEGGLSPAELAAAPPPGTCPPQPGRARAARRHRAAGGAGGHRRSRKPCMNFHLALLTLCQGLLMVNNVVFIAINGLVGLALAPVGWMATVPMTAYVAGRRAGHRPGGRHQRRWGRQRTFQLGLLVAMGSAGVCAWAALTRNFWLLTAATLVAGYYSANARCTGLLGRAGGARASRNAPSAGCWPGASWAAWSGPNLASWSRDLLSQPFAGAYLALMGVAALSLAVMSRIRSPRCRARAPPTGRAGPRPRSCASRCSSSPPRPAPSATA
jgi:hypothetical protein